MRQCLSKDYIYGLQIFISDPRKVRIYVGTQQGRGFMWWHYQRKILLRIDLSGMVKFCIIPRSRFFAGRHFFIRYLCKLCIYTYIPRPKYYLFAYSYSGLIKVWWGTILYFIGSIRLWRHPVRQIYYRHVWFELGCLLEIVLINFHILSAGTVVHLDL